MNNIKITIRTLFLLLVGFLPSLQAQVLTPEDDGIIADPPRHYHNNRVIPYPFLREADMLWSTRHWERIDVREKINLSLFYPEVPLPGRKSLFDVLVDGILEEGTISEVFLDDRFELPLTDTEVRRMVEKLDTVRDPDDPSIIILVDTIRIKTKDVLAWEIKSDWYFDKQRGEMKNRIIGISPRVKNPRNESEVFNLFWIWFPDARYALSTHQVYNEKNNTKRMNFDQLFHFRKFNSTIYKESNVYDRSIPDYKRVSAMDQLLEAQRIKENLRNMEHDLWEY